MGQLEWKKVLAWIIVALLALFNWLIVAQFLGPTLAAVAVCGFALLTLSPVGAWYTARQMRGRVPTRAEQAQIEAALKPLLERSGLRDYNPRIWVLDQTYPNAWAFGVRDLAVTRGLLMSCSRDELEGVLAHEIGHLTRRHTLIMSAGLAVTTVGNVVSAIVAVIATVLGIFTESLGLASGDSRTAGTSSLFGLLISLFAWLVHLLTRFVNWIGTLALLALGRLFEYEADEAAVTLGAGQGLLSFLTRLDAAGADMNRPVGLLAAYTATHPPLALRIDRLEQALETLSRGGAGGQG